MKILNLDIETAPNLAHIWDPRTRYIQPKMIVDAGYVLCWAAKWVGDDNVMFSSVHQEKPEAMLHRVHSLLDEADAVVHYNGTKFDIPTLNKEFILHGFQPPAPYKQIDLLKTVRNQFKFPYNRLDYVAQRLGVGKKFEHIGHELWIRCMAGDNEAWKMMEEYNKQDVILLEKVYNKLKPWIKGHPNHALFGDNGFVCPSCGSNHFHSRGTQVTRNCTYKRYQCQGCGTWFRSTKNIGPKAGEKFVEAA